LEENKSRNEGLIRVEQVAESKIAISEISVHEAKIGNKTSFGKDLRRKSMIFSQKKR
jgi:hypothetical protein